LLVYICADTGIIRYYRSCDIWSHLVENAKYYRAFLCMNGDQESGDFWHSMGVLAPIAKLEEILLGEGNLDDPDGSGWFNLRTEK
jgi:hypothetical protein